MHPCRDCGRPIEDMFRVLCPACRAARLAVYRGRQTLDASVPGPNLIACCNRWSVITALPWACLRCRRVYGE
jgi:NMD protein affecting ribosome stability and mRNA decay